MNYASEVSQFLHDTCHPGGSGPTCSAFSCFDMQVYPTVHPVDGSQTSLVPMVTGSAAEFYIDPMLPCVGDLDFMFYYTSEMAIPEDCPPPTGLPSEFDANVKVYEIRESPFPGYVLLVLSYLLRKRSSDGSYCSIKYNAQQRPLSHDAYVYGVNVHGPANLYTLSLPLMYIKGEETLLQADSVKCMRSLVWPPQAANWPKRYRQYGWPDSRSIGNVISKGCHVVPIAPRQCKLDEWMSKHHWRLSFSRAEVVLLNSWSPVQQTVYHMLRVFVKTERLTDFATGTVSNYHIKTLMLWACELQPRSWWTAESSIVAVCVQLLRHFGTWLTDTRCQHYFVHKCNLFEPPVSISESQIAAALCRSVSEASLAQWFIDNYIRKCAKLCPCNNVILFEDLRTKAQLQNAMSEIQTWEDHVAICGIMKELKTFILMQDIFSEDVFVDSFDSFVEVASYLMLSFKQKMSRRDLFPGTISLLIAAECFCRYVIPHESELRNFFHCSTPIVQLIRSEKEKVNFYSFYTNKMNSAVTAVWQDKVDALMKYVSAKPHSPEILDFITLAKLYLHRTLKCEGIENNAVCCLANARAAVLYYVTGHYQTAIDHCAMVTRSQDHSQCSSHIVDGKLLPKIDDNIDSALGLMVLYRYVRISALNRPVQQTQRISLFTTELFAHYLTIKGLLPAKCFLAPVSLTGCTAVSVKIYLCQELELYRKFVLESKQLFVSDLLLCKLSNTHSDSNAVDIGVGLLSENLPKLSELIQLLRRNSVETLLSFPRAQIFGPVFFTYFEPLNLYRCCLYERCVQMCQEIVRKMIIPGNVCVPLMSTTYSEFMQLMDADLVSLLGLMLLVNPEIKHELFTITISQLPLSLHLITRCQLTLDHPKTSLLQTLKLIDTSFRIVSYHRIFDRPVLQLSRKQLLRKLSYGTIQVTPSAKATRYHRPPSKPGIDFRQMSILFRRFFDIMGRR